MQEAIARDLELCGADDELIGVAGSILDHRRANNIQTLGFRALPYEVIQSGVYNRNTCAFGDF